MAIWLNQLLSQVVSPRLASTSAVSTRRSTTPVAASENFDSFHQQATARGSSQHVPASEVNPWLGADMWIREEKRDRDLESVQTLSEKRNLHAHLEQKAELAVQGKCAAQNGFSEGEAENRHKKLGAKKL